jgi:hypothetical protein
MGNKMTVEMSLSSDDDKISINPRAAISKISKENRVENGEGTPFSENVKLVLKEIKDDGKHAFTIEWQPPDKYKSLFPNLKKNRKAKFNVFINFLLRDSDGKNLFLASGACRGAAVKDAVGGGARNAVKQTVKFECDTFEPVGI